MYLGLFKSIRVFHRLFSVYLDLLVCIMDFILPAWVFLGLLDYFMVFLVLISVYI